MPGRFGRAGGRFFSVKDEQSRLDRDIAQYQQVYGTEVAWYFLLPPTGGTVVNDIYDEGDIEGGKAYDGPHRMPVLAALPTQAQDNPDDQGLITYDRVTLKMSFEQVRKAGLEIDLIENREAHLHDRFVWRNRVFDVEGIETAGHFDPAARDVTILVHSVQVRPDELVDSPEFQKYYY